MKTIPLSRGMVALIDDEDFEAVTAVGSWHAVPSCQTFYARKNYWTGKRCRSFQMHSLITGWRLVDHRNGDGLDNRRANLRQADPSQNAMNRARRSDNKSGYKGVCWHSRAGGWEAQITVAGRKHHLGIFDDPMAAAVTYDAAAREHFGEYAVINFPANDQERAA